MGPESHHELIRRSANITGFLIVTNTTTVDIRHALWQPVVNNKDPRIVQATLAMHQEMIPNMSIPLLVELSKRIKDIPFSSFDAHMMELVSRLLETIRNNFYQQQVVHLDPPPYEMLIQLIRMASREEENTTPSGGLPPSTMFEFAGKELMALAEYGPAGELRRKIYLDCISDIKQMKSSATGSINVIQAFLQQRPRNVRPGSPGYVEDIEFLIKNLNLAELLVNEIARFVDSHSKHDQYSTLRRLKARLELLQFILYNSPECLTAHLGEKLWTYLVGVKALGTSERDDGFEFYINHYLKITAQADPILESVFKIYFPALDPACFSPNVLPFCTKSIEYLNKPTGLADNFEEDCVNFEGVEQLWRIILKAPDDKLAAEATSYFMNLYLDTRAVCSKPAKVIENTHFMIVERCINQLTSTASNIDNTVPTVNTRDENAMSLDTFHGNSDTQEFFRSLDLLDHFVKGYKSRPKYNQGSQEANQSSAVDMITGVPLTLRLRWHASNFQSPIHSFQIGNLDTGQDLHDRIAKIVGGDKYRLIISGREFKPSHEPLKTLKDFCIPDNSVLIVQKSPDQGTVTASSSVPSNLNALQIEIMRHFDSLFELLSLPEPQATKIWFFLRNFPVDEHIKSSMISGSSWSETFPADYPYKTLYSLHALRTCFEEQRQQQNSDEKSTFINEATASLLKTLMNNNHESKESYAMKTRAQVTNEILDCLRLFLQECGFSPPFPNPEDFVERIFEILRVCSQKDYSQCPGSESCVANAFNVLLIASKIDSKINDKRLG
ncbi:hypothetical protein DFP73DRAFT_134692 [Morchella snyderi]|nr:hypothetical protein DFP73DRAFT_134692 [Morchella snyderi]